MQPGGLHADMRICDYRHMTRDDGRFEDAAELFRALASPVRVGLLLELTAGERCVHDLVDALGLAQPLVSQHLRILRAADLVVGRRRGREVAYSLRDDHVAHIVRDAVHHVSEPTEEQGAIA
jgi:DNA-binding transcriptional ArsR family regulator